IFFTQGVGTDLTPSDFMGYSNPLWGFFFKTLFTIIPHAPWYGWVMVSVQFFSLGALLYAFLLSSSPRFKALLLGVSFLMAYSTIFTSLQFTVTSSLAAQSGFFLAAALWRDGKNRPGAAWAAASLLFLSSL